MGATALALLASCRSNPLAVVDASSALPFGVGLGFDRSARTAAADAGVPPVRRIGARFDSRTLTFTARYNGLGLRRIPPFSPDQPGGWCYQLFLDVDGPETGVAGLDYVIRSMERDAQGRVALRRTEGGTGPGGWGDLVAMVPVVIDEHHVEIVIPLDALGPDDGRATYVFELYRTVAGEGPESPVAHLFVQNFEGTSSGAPGENRAIVSRRGAIALRANRLP